MSDCKIHVLTYVTPSESLESQEEAKKIILSKLSSKEIDIQHLIDILGGDLTHENDIRRNRGKFLLKKNYIYI